MGRPRKPEGEKMVQIRVAVRPAMRDALRELAEERDVSMSQVARAALMAWYHRNLQEDDDGLAGTERDGGS